MCSVSCLSEDSGESPRPPHQLDNETVAAHFTENEPPPLSHICAAICVHSKQKWEDSAVKKQNKTKPSSSTLAFLCTRCITLAFFVHFRRSVVPLMWQAVILGAGGGDSNSHLSCCPVFIIIFFNFLLYFFFFFTVSVFTSSKKKTKKNEKDQNQTNRRKLRVFPVPQCHVAEQKECQGFNVPRLYHSALILLMQLSL